MSGIRANLQELEQVDNEGLDLLVVMRADASGAVDDKDEIQRGGFARVICDRKDVTIREPNAANLQILMSTKGERDFIHLTWFLCRSLSFASLDKSVVGRTYYGH